MTVEAARLRVVVGAETSAAERKLTSFSNRLENTAQRAKRAGSLMSLTFTAPLLTLGGLAVRSGIDFESAFAGVIKTVDATDAQLATLRQGILDMSRAMPQSAADIASIAEVAGQLGIQTDNILGFTRTMADLGTATNLSAEDAATALARLANITQMPQENFDRLGSTVVALGNNLATTESEIVEMALRLAAAGKQVGLSEHQILSFSGALSSVGIAAEAGGSAFSRVMIDMANAAASGGEKLRLFSQVAGMTSDAFATMFQTDPAGAIIAFVEGLGRLSREGVNVFPILEELELADIRVRDALLRAAGAGDLFSEALRIGSQAWEENIALTTEAEQRYRTTQSMLSILGNKAREAGILLFDHFQGNIQGSILGVSEFVGSLGNLIGHLSETNPALLNAGAAFLGILAATGPVLLVLSGLVSTLGLLNPVILLAAAGVAAFVAAWSADFGGIQEKVASLRDTLTGLKDAAATRININELISGNFNLADRIVKIQIRDVIDFKAALTPAGSIEVVVNENQFSFDVGGVIAEINTQAGTIRTALTDAYSAAGWAGVRSTIAGGIGTFFSQLLTDVQLAFAFAGLAASTAFGGGDTSTLAANVGEWVGTLKGSVVSAFTAAFSGESGINLKPMTATITDGIDRLFSGVNERLETYDFAGLGTKTTDGVNLVLAGLSPLAGLRNEVLISGAANLGNFVTNVVNSATQFVSGLEGQKIATLLAGLTETLLGGISVAAGNINAADVGTALGNFTTTLTDRLAETLGAEGFGLRVGRAVGEAAGSLGVAATELVTSFATQLQNANMGALVKAGGIFVTQFVRGVNQGLKATNLGQTIADALAGLLRLALTETLGNRLGGILFDQLASAQQSRQAGLESATRGTEAIDPISWEEFIQPLGWTTFVPTINWSEYVPRFNWNRYLSRLNWGAWVNNLSWTSFIPSLDWGRFIGFLNLGGGSSSAPGSLDDPALGAPSGGGGGGSGGFNALGTSYWRGGLTMVGEQGREMVSLPRGSKIFSNRETEEMLGGTTINVGPVHIHNDLDAEVWARKIAAIGRKKRR